MESYGDLSVHFLNISYGRERKAMTLKRMRMTKKMMRMTRMVVRTMESELTSSVHSIMAFTALVTACVKWSLVVAEVSCDGGG